MAHRIRSRRRHRAGVIRFFAVAAVGALAAITAGVVLTQRDFVHARIDAEIPMAFAPATARPAPLSASLPGVPQRAVFPYSVVPGGVESVSELGKAIATDPVVADHYKGFDLSKARVERLRTPKVAYVSYRVGEHVYWTRKPLVLPAGERVITDGNRIARTRCANQVAALPGATSPAEPAPAVLDTPLRSRPLGTPASFALSSGPGFSGTASSSPGGGLAGGSGGGSRNTGSASGGVFGGGGGGGGGTSSAAATTGVLTVSGDPVGGPADGEAPEGAPGGPEPHSTAPNPSSGPPTPPGNPGNPPIEPGNPPGAPGNPPVGHPNSPEEPGNPPFIPPGPPGDSGDPPAGTPEPPGGGGPSVPEVPPDNPPPPTLDPPPGGGDEPGLPDPEVPATIPEPSSVILMLSGAGGLLARHLRAGRRG